jgi:hypothetical protein
MWQATEQILPKTQRFQKVSESTWSQLLAALQVCAEAPKESKKPLGLVLKYTLQVKR